MKSLKIAGAIAVLVCQAANAAASETIGAPDATLSSPWAADVSAAARSVRWVCHALAGGSSLTYNYQGVSPWYTPNGWLDQQYKDAAAAAAMSQCATQSGGMNCYLMNCNQESRDSDAGRTNGDSA